ncbi:EcsC family protein [Streptomyces sp. GESEQ-4]|uniref:EcsC family protein n=1 Tax=Streptomyces sp. GESEQ-4 TaxID=2812655 RepID=UPI001FF0CD07|nr:EcsC family protein [Streptomyces sp. GESEQ-4]
MGRACTTQPPRRAVGQVSLFYGYDPEEPVEKLFVMSVVNVGTASSEVVRLRLTKKGLGKAVPAFGIVVGGTLNWTTLEGIVDAAEMAYRRRFLLDKYPHLADEEAAGSFPDTSPDGPDVADDADEEISLLDEIAEAGEPDLR